MTTPSESEAGTYHDTRPAIASVETLLQQKKTRASGAGVKPDDGLTPLDRKQVCLDPSSQALLSRVGGGNLSLGIVFSCGQNGSVNVCRDHQQDQSKYAATDRE